MGAPGTASSRAPRSWASPKAKAVQPASRSGPRGCFGKCSPSSLRLKSTTTFQFWPVSLTNWRRAWHPRIVGYAQTKGLWRKGSGIWPIQKKSGLKKNKGVLEKNVSGKLIYVYKGGYWENSDKQDWSMCPDIY